MPDSSDLAVVRSWCGPNVGANDDRFDADDLDERIARLDTAEAAALEILRTLQAEMLTGGALTFSVTGDYSQDASVNARLLEARIEQLERITGATDVSVSFLTRDAQR